MSTCRARPTLLDISSRSSRKSAFTLWLVPLLVSFIISASAQSTHARPDSTPRYPKPDTAVTIASGRSGTILVPVASRAALLGSSVIFGTASMYNPFRPGYESGGPETASGERYDAEAWTAAIKTGLRGQFGGVRYGRNYRTAYALVEGAGKRVVVKINDVGPLMPGRVIDFNERTMRHFDPSLELGLIHHVSVTPLPGENWQPGPVTGSRMVKYCTPLGRRFATTSEISDLLRTLSDRPLEVECGATVDWEPRLFRLMIRGSA
jgi:rare lipoprotein A